MRNPIQRDEMCSCATKNDDIIARTSQKTHLHVVVVLDDSHEFVYLLVFLRVLCPRPRETELSESVERMRTFALALHFFPTGLKSSLEGFFPVRVYYERN